MIRVESIYKSFQLAKAVAKKTGQRTQNAVEGVSFHCARGEVLALLGSNGAGKTTTLRLLSTALSVDSGEIWMDEVPVHRFPRRARHNIGFLSQSTPLYRRLTVYENLMFFGQLYRLEARALVQRIETLADQLTFRTYLHQKVDSLSTGMQQKASIARSILHDPDLLVLDEPTSGLDVAAAQQILDFVLQQRSQGKAIVFSTHHMHEVELLADRLCVIDQGRTRFTGTVQAAKQHTQQEHLSQAFLALIAETIR